ncbi:hypothetical protein FBEOM_10666 [Fusarium beomiforme]|uniref:Metalloproteases (Zincins), catalytic n=1 Tax=Fusarium beomiforme TaxID=44412 RepID=A0A9P5DUR1_9HYPO|nr:hypothetical protein FBEOM_10666 [Fusarium beomiforme]
MVLFNYLWLFFGLVVVPISATEATETTTAHDSTATTNSLLKIWDIDDGCESEIDYIEDSMSIALEIVTAAHEALEFVSRPIPDEEIDRTGRNRWVSIYKCCMGFFGFEPTENENYFNEVKAHFAKMKKTIPADQNDPAHGYIYELRDLPNAKPKMMCGDATGAEKWKWYSVTDTLPGEHEPISSMKKYEEISFEYPGAWVYDHRLVWAHNEDEKPILCPHTRLAAVLWDKDIVVICDEMFYGQAKAVKSPREWKKSGIVAGAQLNDYHQDHLSVVLVHELCHWFGGAVRNKEGMPAPIFDDQTALDGDGRPIYRYQHRDIAFNIEPSHEDAISNGYERVLAYGADKVWSLARCSKKRIKQYCGPKKGTKNADSLALFALAMYYDQWDWSHSALARIPGSKKRPGEEQGGREW